MVLESVVQAITETEENLKFLKTMLSWFEQLHENLDPKELANLFPPLTHTLLLVWQYSRFVSFSVVKFLYYEISMHGCRYYHQSDKFHNLLRLISNEVVHRAEAMVGDDVLREPLEVSKLLYLVLLLS